MNVRARMGEALRHARAEAGLSQTELSRRLGISRTTLANIEAGRQGISGPVRQRLRDDFPGWMALIAEEGGSPLSLDNSGLAVDELNITYVFEESRSPSEIIQVRRVRALRTGVRRYHLAFQRSDQRPFSADTQSLWGGAVIEYPDARPDWTLHSVDFGRGLKRGETHEFALRSWVERDAEPDTEIWLQVTTPTRSARLQAAFNGTHHAARAWYFTKPREHEEQPPTVTTPIATKPGHPITATFENLEPGIIHALSWQW